MLPSGNTKVFCKGMEKKQVRIRTAWNRLKRERAKEERTVMKNDDTKLLGSVTAVRGTCREK